MKRSFLLLALLLLFAITAHAQLTGGNITGTATDEQGRTAPGVTVDVRGTDITQTFTTDGDGRYRFLDLAPGSYKVTASLQGFTTIVRDHVIVDVGKTVDLSVQLKVSPIDEVITVTAASPIVDSKETGTATNFTADELAMIPTSRDPFALLRSVAGVLIDRVNIAGNETGQQPNFASKGTRPQDAVWTIDGVVVTDMTLTGASPTYFNHDNFEEVQVSTAGQKITQPTGGVGLNLVVKRGTNQFHGGVRTYLSNDALASSNVPAELLALGVTPATADHNKQISDYGGEIGGPIVRDKAWFYGSYSIQDIRLVRRAGNLIDRTRLKNPDVKLNWQATPRDLVSFLYFDGLKIKDYRSPGTAGILFDAPTATFHQGNAYTDTPLHGLWKIGDDRVIGRNMFLSAKYAYYNTGFILDPEGGMSLQAGRDLTTSRSFGSTSQSVNLRPQMSTNFDLNSFLTRWSASHDLKYGFQWRRVNATTGTLWPGNGILALQNSPTALFAELFRQGRGTNRASYLDFYAGDTISLNRMTFDLGVRYDRQWGAALPGVTQANSAFPDVLPGLRFAGYDAPFTWNNVSPRAGFAYTLDEAKKTVLRANYSWHAGQLDTGGVGSANPSSSAGAAIYRWLDLNGDHFAQADEVQLNQFVAAANGFNPANPTAVTSSNVLDPNLKAPVTQSFVAGFDRELLGNLAVQINYTRTRTTNLLGNATASVTPRVGVTLADYTPGPTLTGTLPDGSTYSVPTFVPVQANVTAGGNGFLLTNWNGYSTDYNGLELSLVKRLSNRWMARVSFSSNDAREHYGSQALYDTNGNPTRTVTEPLVDGGQFAPQSSGNGSGNVYINAKWQLNANAMYRAPFGLEVAGNVFGRQGYPFPLFRSQALGADTGLPVLVTPQIDTFRYPDVWDTDLRVARTFRVQTVSLRLIGDVFNAFNANTALVRNNNVLSTSFNALAQNLSPRVVRMGLVVGF